MSLPSGSLVRVANIPAAGFNSIDSGTGIGVLGSNTNGVSLFTAGSYGSRIITLIASSNDTATQTVFIYASGSAGAAIPIGSVVVTARAGDTGSIKNVDFLNGANIVGLPYDNTGRQYIPLDPDYVLKASVSGSAVSSGKTIWLYAYALNYQAP